MSVADTIMPMPMQANRIRIGYSARYLPPAWKKRGAIISETIAAI